MISNLLLFLSFTGLGSLGGYFFKKASSPQKGIIYLLFNKNLYFGGVFYCLGAILNIIALKRLPYTVVLPISSITYVWTMVFSYFLLRENITFRKVVGVILIIIGAWISAITI